MTNAPNIDAIIEDAVSLAREGRIDEGFDLLYTVEPSTDDAATCMRYCEAEAQMYILDDNETQAANALKRGGVLLREAVIESHDIDDAVVFAANRLRVAALLCAADDCRQAAAVIDEGIAYLEAASGQGDGEIAHLLGVALGDRGRCLAHSGRLADAIVAIERAIEQHSACDDECRNDRAETWAIAGFLRGRAGRCADSVEAWRNAFACWSATGHADTCDGIQQARKDAVDELVHVGEYDEAIAHLTRLVEQIDDGTTIFNDEGQAEVFQALGSVLETADRSKEAAAAAGRCAEAYQRIAAKDESWGPGVATALCNAALSLRNAGEIDAALATYERALPWAGDDAEVVARSWSGRREILHEEYDDHAGALAASEALITWFRDHQQTACADYARALHSDSVIRRCDADYEGALASIEEAVAVAAALGDDAHSVFASASADLAEALICLGRTREAIEAFAKSRLAYVGCFQTCEETSALEYAIGLAPREVELYEKIGDAAGANEVRAAIAAMQAMKGPRLAAVS